MKFESVWLDEDTRLDCYLADSVDWYTRKAILVIPGGGYEVVSAQIEGEPIALAFIPYGFNAFVLHYSVDRTHPYPYQLIQASKAMKYIRDHAEEYKMDSEQVYAVGFSAGGHLCTTLGLQWNKQEVYDAVPMPYGYNKPKGILPIYPVVSAGEYAHEGSVMNLLCNTNPTKEQRDSVSMELHVTSDASPAYIVHGASDECVPVENSLLLAGAYSKAGVPFELHIYPKGKHAFGLGNETTDWEGGIHTQEGICDWLANAVIWMKTL